MAERQDVTAVLLPIKPCFAEKILSGEKRVEFRKTRFRCDVSHVVVYASSPIQRILGYFRISHVDEASPPSLWKRYSSVGGISRSALMDYFADSELGVAIGIAQVVSIPHPLRVSSLGRTVKVPQSFSYLEQRQFARIQQTALETVK
jgi:predicted transcriptional regulator